MRDSRQRLALLQTFIGSIGQQLVGQNPTIYTLPWVGGQLHSVSRRAEVARADEKDGVEALPGLKARPPAREGTLLLDVGVHE